MTGARLCRSLQRSQSIAIFSGPYQRVAIMGNTLLPLNANYFTDRNMSLRRGLAKVRRDAQDSRVKLAASCASRFHNDRGLRATARNTLAAPPGAQTFHCW